MKLRRVLVGCSIGALILSGGVAAPAFQASDSDTILFGAAVSFTGALAKEGRLTREGALPLDAVMTIADGICAGLQAAQDATTSGRTTSTNTAGCASADGPITSTSTTTMTNRTRRPPPSWSRN